jgi:serine/threonine-protein kinase
VPFFDDDLMALTEGQTLDRYTIETLVGEGGMGRVYRAFDARLHRHVALKVLRVTAGDTENGVADVLREARAAAAITHPNATAVFDAGELEGRACIVMEYVPGISLRRLIGSTEVPLRTRLHWLVDIAGALGAAHQVGVIHRDIKPENVMIRDDGLLKVLDFGVAGRTRLVDSKPGTDAVEMVTPSGGNAVGTPAYMSPEQVRGAAIDGRADQFGWAVLAYELLTGRLPWKTPIELMASIVAVLTEQVDAPSRLVPEIPMPVDSTILRALSKSPADRFPSMLAVAAALSAAFSDGPPPPSSRSSVQLLAHALRTGPTALVLPTGPDLTPIIDVAARSTFAARIPTPRASKLFTVSSTPLRAPRDDVPVELEEHLRRVPSGATVKGMFFLELQRVAGQAGVWPKVLETAGVAERRYYNFRDYPMVDNLRLTAAVATHVHPGVAQGNAIRHLGQTALDVVLGSHIGRAIFGGEGRDLEPLFLRGPRAYKLLLGVGEVTSEKVSSSVFRFHAKNFPAFLETYQIGVIEGVLRHCGRSGQVRIAMDDLANAMLEVEIN